jgi:hypothetical protein
MKAPRSITVFVHEEGESAGHFTIYEGDSFSGELVWDELLAEIARLTNPAIGSGRYMQNIDRRLDYLKRRAAHRAGVPC